MGYVTQRKVVCSEIRIQSNTALKGLNQHQLTLNNIDMQNCYVFHCTFEDPVHKNIRSAGARFFYRIRYEICMHFLGQQRSSSHNKRIYFGQRNICTNITAILLDCQTKRDCATLYCNDYSILGLGNLMIQIVNPRDGNKTNLTSTN